MEKLSNFLKGHLLGIFSVGVLASIAGTFAYDWLKGDEQMANIDQPAHNIPALSSKESEEISNTKSNSTLADPVKINKSTPAPKDVGKVSKTDYVEPYSVELINCVYSDNATRCKFTVSADTSSEIFLHRNSRKGKSVIYLEDGRTVEATSLSIGNSDGHSEVVKHQLPPNFPVVGSVGFEGIELNKISLLELSISRTVLHKPQYARFRNISVSGS